MIGRAALMLQLTSMGIVSGSVALNTHDAFETMLKNVWADNADEMSRRYTGVEALK